MMFPLGFVLLGRNQFQSMFEKDSNVENELNMQWKDTRLIEAVRWFVAQAKWRTACVKFLQ